jgi:type III restriction enzyme
MKLKFKKQAFQSAAVEAVIDCFAGQPMADPLSYRLDPGRRTDEQQSVLSYLEYASGFRNVEFAYGLPLLKNIQEVQRRQNLPISSSLVSTNVCPVNLDIEMETGTGKTYCYIKAMFELNRRYGWSKFIVVVPSIAIREGVHKSFEITAEHFLEQYAKRARFFIYNSKRLHELESYSSDAGINVMIINVQAFAARGKDARRIYAELDDFQSRRPIDVLKANRPILILDEPQKMEGKQTLESFKEFNPLMILRYSATHKTQHNKIYRLDALDAYNQKLVKKIAVRGISVRGLSGTNGYLYLESIQISPSKPPVARVEMETKLASGVIKRVIKRLSKNDNLHTLSGELDQYRGFVVAEIDARTDTLSFTNGVELHAGEATGDINEATLRQIQIREAIKAHFEREEQLFEQGVKVLTLFFIDEVAKYRQYDDAGEKPGEYAEMFVEEYRRRLEETLTLYDTPYTQYLKGIDVNATHNGYFSIDRTSRWVDPKVAKRGELAGESEDVDAYDLILRNKEQLLSLEEPVRFIFSHSALREGWDNPNVFVICTLKHSDSTISRRQEVGRGMRLSVYSDGPRKGERNDDPATVHQVNVLTVVANESYRDFVAGLQRDISQSLSERPRLANEAYFTGKLIQAEAGTVEITPQLAKQIYRYLVKNDYTDNSDHVSSAYHDAKAEGVLAPLPDELKPHAQQVFQLIDSVFSDVQIPIPEDGRRVKVNPLNDTNFEKKEFQELWKRINRKAAYTVHFESDELVRKCVRTVDKELKITPLQYTVQRGSQRDLATQEDLNRGAAFEVSSTETLSHKASVHSAVRYDLIGNISDGTQLTRRTVARILREISPVTFTQYRMNPEDFIAEACRIINEQKATVIVEQLIYDPVGDVYDIDIFTQQKPQADFSKAYRASRHIYDYVFTDSKNEREFVEALDGSEEVVVYAKLPRGFFIPTPVGNYNPDWAIAFEHNRVKHVYFIAETKGSMSSMELREIERRKIDCARKFFTKITAEQVKYDVVDSYSRLMALVSG